MYRAILDFLAYLAIFLLLRSIFRSSMTSRRRPPAAPPRDPVQPGGELKKDPVCGTYVSVAASYTLNVNGQTLHFCSKECRDRYPG
ncbi:MAG TPA: hypothetical protein VMU19_15785 [Bryobacteraceae bacterium]|nr:hypothetical protein [Bryobacteraceae bacterium]